MFDLTSTFKFICYRIDALDSVAPVMARFHEVLESLQSSLDSLKIRFDAVKVPYQGSVVSILSEIQEAQV
jgi:hypothetical protein